MQSPTHTLHYGKSKKPLAWVKPDERYPTMWRIHWPDGEVSDMVNLSRACDAGAVLLRRRRPELDWKLLHWDRTTDRSGGSPMHSDDDPAVL
jgi:hypothetical protein